MTCYAIRGYLTLNLEPIGIVGDQIIGYPVKFQLKSLNYLRVIDVFYMTSNLYDMLCH